MRPPLGVLPSADAPTDVTIERIAHKLEEQGHAVQQRDQDSPLQLETKGRKLTVRVHRSSGILSVRGQWETGLPFDQVEYSLFAATDSWNRRNLFPTLYTMEDADGAAIVFADFSALIGAGMHDAHLDEVLSVGVEQGARALSYLRGAANSVLGLGETDR